MTGAVGQISRLGRYGIVGAGTNLSLYLLFLLFVWGGTPPVFTSGMCYVLGVAMSYLLNRHWTFASTTTHRRDLPRFILAYGVGLAVTLVAMTFLVAPLGAAVAQIVTIVLAALSIFSTLMLLRFGQ